MTYDRRADDESEVDPKAAKALAPGRLLDLMALVLSLDAIQAAEGPDEVQNRGKSLYRQHRGSLEEAMRLHIYPIVERDDAGVLQSKVHLFEAVQPERKARFIELLLEWLHRHPTLLRDVFSGRAYGNAQKVAAAVADTDPKTRLQKLSLVPTSSGLSAPLRWIDKAAESVGAAPSPVDTVASHAEAAQGIVDEIRTVKTELEATPPQSPQAKVLEARKAALDAELDSAIMESDNPQAVLASATASMAQNPKSRIVQEFGLTEEQAAVVASKGNVVVAAGAGSGKTQTAVAWIASLVKEQGYAPEQILACSFTRAASSELNGRVQSQGGVQGAEIGTTHHIARMVIKHAHPELDKVMKATKNADKCFKMALKQVPLSVEGHAAKVEANKELLAKIESISGWRSNDFLQSLHRQLESGRTLSPGQLGALEKWSRPRYPTYQRRRWAEDYSEPTPEIVIAAGPESGGDEDKFSQYWNTPVGEWFNLGEDLVDGAGKPIGFKRASLAVENFKNGGISVEQAWQQNKDTPGFDRLMAAVYGAYEWLKKNDPVLAPAMDYTDQLIKALDILTNEPKVLEAMQRRFKVVIVDEAQDLNQIQFNFFERLGGKADVLAYVGDDKQSIYAFRGAKPKNYVDLTKKEGFQTKSITMNFRSGKAIVDAANRLIAHNEDRQIPMVCEADVVRKGMGEIIAKETETHEDAANQVAQEIKDAVDAGESLSTGGGKSRFGILVRNNAEADAYTLSLIARGIPYRMLKKGEGGYFGKPLVKALTAWMSLATGQDVNDAVIEAHMTPGFGLDKAFSRQLGVMARGSYLDHILAGKPVYTDRAAWKNGKNVTPYANAIRGLMAQGTSDSETLIRNILAIKGTKGTFEDSLLALVDEEDVIEDEGSLNPSEDALRTAAMAPLRPLMEMARNFTDPQNFMMFVAKMKAANEKTQKKSPEEPEDWKEPAVLVGTVHGWKGLQAKHVYVSMAGGIFPNFRTDEKAAVDPTAYDEERRLAYVAITRGEDSVTVMSPAVGYTGKPSAGPSRFIAESCVPVQGQKTEVKSPEGEEVEPDSGSIEKMASRGFGFALFSAMEEIPALEPPP